jgi:hypothetical protein
VFKVEYIASGVLEAPLIRIFSSDTELRQLSTLLAELINGFSDRVSVEKIVDKHDDNNCKLILIRSQHSTGIQKTGGNIFECRLDRYDWENVMGLIDGVIEYSGPCSQWLYDQGEVALVLSTNQNGAW